MIKYVTVFKIVLGFSYNIMHGFHECICKLKSIQEGLAEY